ncbi:MAG: DUF2203 domain-containing protein [Chloroflexi bacterium]|nr:DUF2203 domain-containing protein [Chloroflexota bacterium]
MITHYFTVEETNAMLPWLRETVRKILHLQGQINALAERVQFLGKRTKGNGGGALGNELAQRQAEIKSMLDEVNELGKQIQEKGCILRDADKSIVDFPAQREGREIYLCWRLGEDEVKFWHEVDSGFAGRQPL